MDLSQPVGALLQCLELCILPLLPPAALTRLSCTCTALHTWLTSEHTTPAWIDSAAKDLPAAYLPLAPDLSRPKLMALLQGEAAVQRQLRQGQCASVIPVEGHCESIRAFCDEYFVCDAKYQDRFGDGKLIATRAGSTALSWHPLKPIVALSSVVQDIEQLVLWDFVLDQDFCAASGHRQLRSQATSTD